MCLSRESFQANVTQRNYEDKRVSDLPKVLAPHKSCKPHTKKAKKQKKSQQHNKFRGRTRTLIPLSRSLRLISLTAARMRTTRAERSTARLCVSIVVRWKSPVRTSLSLSSRQTRCRPSAFVFFFVAFVFVIPFARKSDK